MRTRPRYALVILFPVDGVLFILSLIPTLVYALANKSLPTMAGPYQNVILAQVWAPWSGTRLVRKLAQVQTA